MKMIFLTFIFLIIYFTILPILYKIFEILILTFSPEKIFWFGFKVKEEKLDFDFNIDKSRNTIIKKTVGKYFLEKNTILALQHKFWLGWYNLKTIYSPLIKGDIGEKSVLIKKKLPILPIIHLIIGLLFIIGIIMWTILTNQELILTIGSLIFLIIPLIGIGQIFLIEDDNYQNMLEEIREIITTHNNGYHK